MGTEAPGGIENRGGERENEIRCEICGEPSTNDLFAAITGEPVCSICKLKYIGGLPTTSERIAAARSRLALKDGEFLQQNNAEEARQNLRTMSTVPRIKSGNTIRALREKAIRKFLRNEIGLSELARKLGVKRYEVEVVALKEIKRMFRW